MEIVQDSKKEIVRGIIDNQLQGEIPQRELARTVKGMPVERFTEGLDGLVREGVLRDPEYKPKIGVVYSFRPRVAEERGYI